MLRLPLAAIAIVIALPAAAQTAAPKALSTILLDFESRGYQVLELDVKRSRVEITAIDPAGQQVEIDVDPLTGATVREQRDD